MILLTIQFTVLQSSIFETWPALYSGSINLLENNTLLDMHKKRVQSHCYAVNCLNGRLW